MKKLILFTTIITSVFATNIKITKWNILSKSNGSINQVIMKNIILVNINTKKILDSKKVLKANKKFTLKECKQWKNFIQNNGNVIINFIDKEKTTTIMLDKKICNFK